MEKIPMTAAGYTALENELKHRQQVERHRIIELLATHEPSQVAGVKVDRIRSDDGFKFFLEDGSWVLLRTSGTEPLIRVYSEAPTKADVEARLAAIEDIVGLRSHA